MFEHLPIIDCCDVDSFENIYIWFCILCTWIFTFRSPGNLFELSLEVSSYVCRWGHYRRMTAAPFLRRKVWNSKPFLFWSLRCVLCLCCQTNAEYTVFCDRLWYEFHCTFWFCTCIQCLQLMTFQELEVSFPWRGKTGLGSVQEVFFLWQIFENSPTHHIIMKHYRQMWLNCIQAWHGFVQCCSLKCPSFQWDLYSVDTTVCCIHICW